MKDTLPVRVRFGAFELDLQTGELHGLDGKLRLAGKSFRLLVVLTERAGNLVTREEIQSQLWPNDTVVDFEHGINATVRSLRRALGDSAEEPKYVETLARRGYRLLVPVYRFSPEQSSQSLTETGVSNLPSAPVAGPSADSAVLIGRKVSHYRVLDIIGGGGMGVVYRAEDLKLVRAVALKFLPEELGGIDPVALRRFEREAQTASSLDHPNICAIHEFGEHDGRPFMVMPLLEGRTLRDRLAEAAESERRLPMAELLHIAIQISDGLQAAHDKGIIHRDIKPANIFLTSKGVVKILDFGLAKVVVEAGGFSAANEEDGGKGPQPRPGQVGGDLKTHEPSAGSRQAFSRAVPAAFSDSSSFQPATTVEATLTRTGLAMGTAGYMSPEQLCGEELDARTDLFSLGLVLYEMATGQRAFARETAAVVRSAILNSTPAPLRELNPQAPAALEAVVNKTLEKDRERRYQSAGEVRNELESLKRGDRKSVHLTYKWLAVVALLAVLTVGGWLYWQARSRVTLTNHDTVVLADFTNRTSDPVFGDALNTALRTELEQTPFLNILSSDKVRGTLKEMGRSEDKKLTTEMSRDVCLQTNSKAVVAGSITDAGNRYRLGLKAVGCQSGKTLATAETEVGNRNEIVRMLGVAGGELRRKLGEPKESLQNFSKPLDEATSASPEALQAYTEGVREEPQRLTAAAPHFKRATELDPDYAMAYAWQAALGSSDAPMKAAANKAYELRARLTDRDRFAVEHMYYRDVTGELDKAIAVFEQWTRIFPLDSVPGIGLAIALSSLGQNARSAAEAREAIRLEPGIDGYNYLMLADISLGRFDDAKTVYEEALARKFDSLELRLARYRLAFLQGDDAAMQEQVNWAAKTPDAEGPMLWSQFSVEAYRGRVRKAHAYAQRVMDWGHRMESSGADPEHKATEAMMDAEAGFLDRAHEEATWALSRASELSARLNVAMAFARVGDVPTAQKLVEELNQEYPLDTVTQNYYLPTLQALIALHTNNPGRAIEALRRAAPYELAKTVAIDQLYPAYVRGLAYLQLGQGQQAAAEFQKLLDHRGIVAFWLTGPLAHLQLARAQMMTGDKAAARKSYQEFLTLWEDADPDIPIYQQAKAEYATLK